MGNCGFCESNQTQGRFLAAAQPLCSARGLSRRVLQPCREMCLGCCTWSAWTVTITVESPHRGNPSSWPQCSCQPGVKCLRLFKKLLLGSLRTLHVIHRLFKIDQTRGNHDFPRTTLLPQHVHRDGRLQILTSPDHKTPPC